MTRRITFLLGFWAIACSAQTTVNGGRVFTGILRSSGASATVDFSGAGSTVPVETGSLAARPANCIAGQMYFATDAAAGQNLSYCTGSPGAWTTAIGGEAAGPTVVQTNQSNSYTAGTQDFSGAAHTLPTRTGTIALLPSTCITGEMYFATDATAGRNQYYCTAANTWTQQAAGGSGSGGATAAGASGSLQANNGSGGLAGQPMIYSNLFGGGAERQVGLNCTPKMVVPYTAFVSSGTFAQVKVATVPAYWFPTALLLNESVEFAAGSGVQISSVAASIGTVGAPSYYVQPLVLMQSGPNFKSDNVNGQPASLTAHDIYVQLSVTNANPGTLASGNLTAGALEVAICGGTWQ